MYEANLAMQEADVVLAVGARFDDRVISVPSKFLDTPKKIIHIDVDPSSIAKRVKVDVPIVGDVKHVLNELIEELHTRTERPDKAVLAAWWQQIEEWRSAKCMKYTQDMEGAIRAQFVIEKLWEVTNGDAYVCSDVGQHQMWAAQYYKFSQPNRWINSGGLGTMGFGLPSAMGVQLAYPDATVACVTGDGSIQMCIQELATCTQYRLPVKIICLNNGYLGMVRQWQEFFYDKRYSMSYMDSLPDFVKLTEAYGHVGMRIERPSDVEGALKEALAMKDRLVFMDFITMQENNVYPMVPAGAGHNEMLLL